MASTYDAALDDPWLAYETAWAFVERSLVAGLGTIVGRRVVDVGCGTGEFLARLVDLGAIGVGVEPSAGMRAEATRKVPAARTLDGHLEAIPLPDGGAEAAIATYVVSHLAPGEQPGALEELLRVVDDGPIVVVDVPCAGPAELPRVRRILRAADRMAELGWYEAGNGLDLRAWRTSLEAAGRRVRIEPLGPLLTGLAALPGGSA